MQSKDRVVPTYFIQYLYLTLLRRETE